MLEFVKCDLHAFLRGTEKFWIDDLEPIQDKINCLVHVSNAKADYIAVPENDTLEDLIQKAINLELKDKHFFKAWFKTLKSDRQMTAFCSIMIKRRTRIHTDWALEEMSKLQQFYKIRTIPMTLKDFNRV